MSSQAENLAEWFAKMVELGEFKNPLPFPLFKATVRKRCKSDSQFDKFAQDVKNALLKHNISVASGWNAYQPQQKQKNFDPWEQASEQQQEIQQQQYSLVLNAHDSANAPLVMNTIYEYKSSIVFISPQNYIHKFEATQHLLHLFSAVYYCVLA